MQDLSYRTENQFAVKPFGLSKRNKADLAQFCIKKSEFLKNLGILSNFVYGFNYHHHAPS